MASLLDVLANSNPVSAAVGGVVQVIGKVLDKVIPDPAAKEAAALELLKLQQSGELAEMTAQTDINKVEAASPNLFVSGWRPAVGWVCVLGLFYSFMLQPILGWIAPDLGMKSAPPALDMGTLITLLGGMLGFGAIRMNEKIKGVAR